MLGIFVSQNFRLILLLYGVILAFYVPFFIFWRKRMRLKFGRRRFLRGVISVLGSYDNDSDCISEMQMLYNRLSAKYSPLRENLRSTSEVMEDLISSIRTSNPNEFKLSFKIDPPTQLLPRMASILNRIKELQPYSSLSSEEANLLNTLTRAIDTGNKDLAKNAVTQLANAIQAFEESLTEKSKRIRLSFTISTVGIILTAFFGSISFVLFSLK